MIKDKEGASVQKLSGKGPWHGLHVRCKCGPILQPDESHHGHARGASGQRPEQGTHPKGRGLGAHAWSDEKGHRSARGDGIR